MVPAEPLVISELFYFTHVEDGGLCESPNEKDRPGFCQNWTFTDGEMKVWQLLRGHSPDYLRRYDRCKLCQLDRTRSPNLRDQTDVETLLSVTIAAELVLVHESDQVGKHK